MRYIIIKLSGETRVDSYIAARCRRPAYEARALHVRKENPSLSRTQTPPFVTAQLRNYYGPVTSLLRTLFRGSGRALLLLLYLFYAFSLASLLAFFSLAILQLIFYYLRSLFFLLLLSYF